MLCQHLIPKALALQITTNSFRGFSSYARAMATPPSSFTLDRSIFNQTLYDRMREFWFSELPDGASAPTYECQKKWWGFDKSQEQKDAFDSECRENFGHALEAIGPAKLALPAFESYEKDIQEAAEIASPLLAEVKNAQSQDDKQASEMLLALLVLLDQMPRNIYRDPAGLRLVFTHYDRLAFTLLYSSMNLSADLTKHESVRLRPAVRWWYLMPLMHSEYLPAHELFEEVAMKSREELVAANDQEAVEHLDGAFEYEKSHVDILRKFGRYPHRNAALGRQTTKEEEEELKKGQTFGVQQPEQEQQLDKSEL